MHRDPDVLAFRCDPQQDRGMPSITIRNVPAEVRDELAARAARSGQSLQEFLLATLTHVARRPDVRTVLERARERIHATGSGLTAQQILDFLDEGRRR
jgi:antitoxin FitA